MAANLIAFLLAGTVCALSGRLTIRNDGDYGPYGGDGPWFALTIDSDVQGDVQLASHCWIVPDGEYRGTLDPDDRSLLDCLIEDIRTSSPETPPYWICPHAPAFEVAQWSPRGTFLTNACISRVQASPLAALYAFMHRAIPRACWTEFTPSFECPKPPRRDLPALPIRRQGSTQNKHVA
jgi:hypothetical protein